MSQLIKHREDLRKLLDQEELVRDALIVSSEAIALRQLTIQEGGGGVDGRFSDYVPAYAQDRIEDGYQVDYKDYTRTGELFRSINPEVVESRPGLVVVEIKARDRENQLKINGAFRKDGNILENTREELDQIRASFAARRNKSLQ